jgi:hypothetical protein
MLLHGRELNHIPDDRATLAAGTKYTRAWLDRKKLLNKVFFASKDSYLMELALTKKWHAPQDEILKVGDVVQIRDPNMVRGHWRLGRVLELSHGKDGKVRQATLKTEKGKIARKINLLSKLEGIVTERLSAAVQDELTDSSQQLPSVDGDTAPEPEVQLLSRLGDTAPQDMKLKKLKAKAKAKTKVATEKAINQLRPIRRTLK